MTMTVNEDSPSGLHNFLWHLCYLLCIYSNISLGRLPTDFQCAVMLSVSRFSALQVLLWRGHHSVIELYFDSIISFYRLVKYWLSVHGISTVVSILCRQLRLFDFVLALLFAITRSPAVAEEPRERSHLKSGTRHQRISIRGQIIATKFCAGVKIVAKQLMTSLVKKIALQTQCRALLRQCRTSWSAVERQL